MPANTLRRQKMTAAGLVTPDASPHWLWTGYLHDGEITLLTSQWKFEANWQQMKKILEGRTTAATHLELLTDWPSDQPKPSASTFYEWLNRAHAEKRVRRSGKGTKYEPWRYRLPNEDDYYRDRGELPPLRPLWEMR